MREMTGFPTSVGAFALVAETKRLRKSDQSRPGQWPEFRALRVRDAALAL